MNVLADILTMTSKGQFTLPAGVRAKFGIKAGDKLFGEEVEDGFIIRKPKKSLMEYEGFIDNSLPLEDETLKAQEGLSKHIFEDKE
jgi:AbrB family looped-hinge helix DNA binding protein